MSENKQPKVSVIIPAYNTEQYLEECLNSVLNQTLKEIEIICIDDGSTDGSVQILDKYAAKNTAIKVIHKTNSGYGATMNLGLSIANGEYIGIVESDDYIRPDMYKTLYEYAKQNNLDVVKADFCIFYGEPTKRTFTYTPILQKSDYYNKLLNPLENLDIASQSKIFIWSGLYKRTFLEQHNIRFHESPGASFQDNGFFFQTYIWAKRMQIISQDFYQLRRDNPNSSFYSKEKAFLMCDEMNWIKSILDKNKECFPKEVYGLFYKKTYYNYLFQLKRIDEERKAAFLERFAKDFSAPLKQGLITEPFFHKSMIKEIKNITYKKQYSDNNISVFDFNYKLSLPLVEWKNVANGRSFKLLGVPLYKMKQKEKENIKQYYILGIPVYKKHI